MVAKCAALAGESQFDSEICLRQSRFVREKVKSANPVKKFAGELLSNFVGRSANFLTFVKD
jgi:hypothetical protein